MTSPAPALSSATLRIDKWLWFARFAKSRSLAAAWVEQGQVRINERVVEKASAVVRVGDVVDFAIGRHTEDRRRRRVTVLALGERRGPAPEAALLYQAFEDICL